MKLKISFILLLSLFLSLHRISFSQDLTPEQIYEKVNDCVVVILSYDFNGKLSKQGSGVVISDKGWVVTNYHVFEDCEKIEIKHNNSIIKQTDIIGVNIEKDILILKINDNTFPSITIGNSDELKIGQRVYAIGSPLGLENSMSEGIISGLRNVTKESVNFIQITASISAGSSGGAVVNTRGDLIGISTMTLREGQNLNFAISVNDILKVTLSSYSNKNDIIVNNFFNKGMYALSEIKYSDAIKYFTRCIEINPNYADAYGRRGCAYNGLKEYYKAISDFTKAIEIQQNGSWAYFMRGHTYKDLKEYSKALSDYTKAIELQSDYGDFYYERGYLYYELKEYDNACKDWNKAKEFGVTGIRNVNSVINKYCK